MQYSRPYKQLVEADKSLSVRSTQNSVPLIDKNFHMDMQYHYTHQLFSYFHTQILKVTNEHSGPNQFLDLDYSPKKYIY